MKKLLAALRAVAVAAMLCCMVVSACAADAGAAAGSTAISSVARAACTLEISYTSDNTGFAGLEIRCLRIAGLDGDLQLQPEPAFRAWEAQFRSVDTETDWEPLLTELEGFVTAEAMEPDRTVKTDKNGEAVFSGLLPGLYLVRGVTAARQGQSCVFEPFLVLLTGRETALTGDGSHLQRVIPKGSWSGPEKQSLRVYKLWQDSGKQSGRPKSIEVSIYRDEKLYKTVTLSDSNSWSCSWEERGSSVWTVRENTVPTGYTATVTRDGNAFCITNTAEQKPTGGTTPNTGDSFPLSGWMVMLAVSGFVLLGLGILLMAGVVPDDPGDEDRHEDRD